MKVNATGFGEVVRTGIEVQANQTSDVPAQMAPAGQVETVNVAADAGQLRKQKPVRGGNIDKTGLQNTICRSQSGFSGADTPRSFS